MSNTALTLAPAGLSSSYGDIDIPRINIVQKMSEIEGPLGSVVLDKESVLLEAGNKLNVVIVGAIKRWKEDIPYDDDRMPKIANTEAEARELATESDFEILEFAEIVMLIPQPGDDDTHFPYPIGDTNYQIGRLTVQKDAYRLTYKRLFTFATFNQNVALSARLWAFSSDLMTKGKYSWYVPSLSITKEETPADVLAFVNSNLKGEPVDE
jgi:hypothetical protein